MAHKENKLARSVYDNISTDPNLDTLVYNNRQIIQWMHIPSNSRVTFGAFVTEYKDSFASEWNETHVYGRMDGIETFKRTKRTISLGWKVLAFSSVEAKDNLNKMSLLMKMLYPSYDSAGGSSSLSLGSTAISSAPLMRLKFMNLISQPNEAVGVNVTTSGLVGKVNGFDFEPNLEAGFLGSQSGELLPKEMQVTCQFTVLHTHALGWRKYGDSNVSSFRQTKYPYGEGGGRDEQKLIAEADAMAAAATMTAINSGVAATNASAEAPDEQREASAGVILS